MSKNVKKTVWILSAILMCLIDVVRNTGNGEQWAFAVNCTGLVVFPFIVCRFKGKDFLKLPYYIWTAVFIIASIPICYFGLQNTYYEMQFISAVLNVGLYGIIVIRIIYLLIEKQFPKLPTIGFILWFSMMILAVLSVNKALWPLWFLVMFGAYYVAPITEEEKEDIFSCISTGMIIAFFLIQSTAFVFRPYDNIRYCGIFVNSNDNATFYTMIYCAWLAKWAQLRRKEAPKWQRFICAFFASAMWSFVFLTLGRASMLAFTIITIFFLITNVAIVLKKGWKGFLLTGVGMFLLFIVSFLPVYGCVRYLPTVMHHPIWFDGEYSESKVHSFDPANSEKYTSLQNYLRELFHRLDASAQLTATENFSNSHDIVSGDEDISNVDHQLESEVINEESQANTAYRIAPIRESKNDRVLSYEDGIEPGSDMEHPAFWKEEYKGIGKILLIRSYIYRFVLERVNLTGHEEIYPLVWITPAVYACHFHSAYMQFTYCYGMPVGILLLALALLMPIMILIRYGHKKETTPNHYAFVLAVILAFVIIGAFESNFFTGNMSFTLFFIAALPLMRREE